MYPDTKPHLIKWRFLSRHQPAEKLNLMRRMLILGTCLTLTGKARSPLDNQQLVIWSKVWLIVGAAHWLSFPLQRKTALRAMSSTKWRVRWQTGQKLLVGSTQDFNLMHVLDLVHRLEASPVSQQFSCHPSEALYLSYIWHHRRDSQPHLSISY